MQFVDAIRAKSLRRRLSSLEDDDPLSQLSSPIPEEKFRDFDMVISI